MPIFSRAQQGQLVLILAAQVLAANLDLAVTDPFQARHQHQHGGFTRSTGADHTDRLPGMEGKRNSFQDVDVT